MKQVVSKLTNLTFSKLALGAVIGFLVIPTYAQKVISLENAVAIAQQNDPWLHGNKLKQKAVEHRSVASGTLPDPKLSISMMNLPTDSWSFDQEGMTQFKVGMSQMFARGDSLTIKENQLKIAASQFPLLRADRKAKLEYMVSELWLDVYLAQQTISLIETDSSLFEQMAEVARASYSSAVGKTRQQDVIRAQLEITQLDDRLAEQKQKLESSMASLNEWLHIYDSKRLEYAFNFDSQPAQFEVSRRLPQLRIANPSLLKAANYSRNKLALQLAQHPAVLAMDVQIKVSEKSIDLAKQQYKPQLGVNASYGYRTDMPSGESRADLFSVGVSLDVPLFTENKQDKQVAASIAESEVVETEKLLLIKQMISAVEKELRKLSRLAERQAIYEEQLLKQTHEQAEASLTAYTNDDGDFAEVVRARIAELNAQISALKINVKALKTVAQINYFLATGTENKQSMISQNSHSTNSAGQLFGGK